MPPGRTLVDAGAAIALATDFNPGSSFTTSLPLVCALAATQLGLSPAEALSAVTVNAAHVVGCAEDRGRLDKGYRADIVLLDAPDWRYLAYSLAGDIVATVVKSGAVAYTG
jgi:imidazolonepropionase